MGGESAATETDRAPGFRDLFDAHYAFVWRTMRHFGLDAASADDAAQDAFVVVHRRLADFDGRTHIRSWLFGIARHVASTHQRGARRAQRRLEHVEPPSSSEPLDEALARSEANDWVAQFLGSLPEAQRDAFYLAEIEGLPAKEVAASLGINVNTAYSRVRLAKERFDQALRRRNAKIAREEVGHG